MSCDELVGEVLPNSYERVDGAADGVKLHRMDSRERREHAQLIGNYGLEFERVRESLDVPLIKARLIDQCPELGLLRAKDLIRPNAEGPERLIDHLFDHPHRAFVAPKPTERRRRVVEKDAPVHWLVWQLAVQVANRALNALFVTQMREVEHALHQERLNFVLTERATVDQSLHRIQPRRHTIHVPELHVREDKPIQSPVLLLRI